MELERLQAEIARLMEGIEHPRVGAALALAEESGELVRCVLEQEVYGDDRREALAGEVGDTLLALVEVCERFGLSLADCASEALVKLERQAPTWREQLGERLREVRERWEA